MDCTCMARFWSSRPLKVLLHASHIYLFTHTLKQHCLVYTVLETAECSGTEDQIFHLGCHLLTMSI